MEQDLCDDERDRIIYKGISGIQSYATDLWLFTHEKSEHRNIAEAMERVVYIISDMLDGEVGR